MSAAVSSIIAIAAVFFVYNLLVICVQLGFFIGKAISKEPFKVSFTANIWAASICFGFIVWLGLYLIYCS